MSKFTTKDKLDSFLFRIFNVFSDADFFLRFRRAKILRKNSAFKDIHTGERCFILGTGPSLGLLSDKAVLALAEERSIAVNSFFKAPNFKHIAPTYYALLDNNYWNSMSNTFAEVARNYKNRPPVMITDLRASSFVPQEIDRIYLYAKHYPTGKMRFDLTKNVSITMNVVSFSILSAIYMGFSEIYLLGCDYNLFCSRIGNHCYDDADEFDASSAYNLGFYLKYYHLTTEFHYMLAKLAKDKGVKIINISDGSLLDAYPSMQAENVLGAPPALSKD